MPTPAYPAAPVNAYVPSPYQAPVDPCKWKRVSRIYSLPNTDIPDTRAPRHEMWWEIRDNLLDCFDNCMDEQATKRQRLMEGMGQSTELDYTKANKAMRRLGFGLTTLWD